MRPMFITNELIGSRKVRNREEEEELSLQRFRNPTCSIVRKNKRKNLFRNIARNKVNWKDDETDKEIFQRINEYFCS